MSHSAGPTLPSVLPQPEAGLRREAVEMLIDQMGDQSFPASDPPTWGVIRARLGRYRQDEIRETAEP